MLSLSTVYFRYMDNGSTLPSPVAVHALKSILTVQFCNLLIITKYGSTQ